MANARDHITIELKKMTTTNLTMSPQRCIFKVPNILKRHNPKAYAPNAFSIGPYHYGEEHLQATQKIKLMYLDDLITGFEDPDTVLETLVGAMREVQQKARDCYGDPFDHISADEFVKILVLDGCFLIQLFRKTADEKLQKDDPVFTVSCMSQLLGHDLILLENQIPWMVLELLFDKISTKLEDSSVQSLSSLLQRYCECNGTIFGDIDAVVKSLVSWKHESNKHILDMLRNSLVLSSSVTHERSHEMEAGILFKLKMGLKSLFRKLICLEKCLPNKEDKSTGWQSMPSAARLREAGIKFKSSTSPNSILDIKFEDGVLEIPPILIHEDTESLFRNLICLEQCLPNCDTIVTSYAILLDNLINTTEDMEILCKGRIFDNFLNTDDATELFNQLYDDAYVKEFHYTDLIKKVQKYCGRHWPRYRTVFIHEYLKHPWAICSIVVAAIFLILTVVQTVFTIIK
ncbi:hypothetical protein TIFTF001_042700 [Ficus carica]|uniref:Uncharacterized protein n=1 Tax=Ficus carica TaxID=3494 RepID=A0AA87ZPF7_FICCA|nr:hypothetical protein TIFTF001_042700 [Ficus carica]